MIKIHGKTLDINVEEELQPYLDHFPHYSIRGDKLQSCSPFRTENHPSFAVNLENGAWIDSGATGEFRKGSFFDLMAFLQEKDKDFLISEYLSLYNLEQISTDALYLSMQLDGKPISTTVFTDEQLQEYAFRSPYLENRGIAEDVQKMFRIGYDRKNKAVVMPWSDADGNIVNIKFRSVMDKRFWYSNGQSVKRHLYSLNHIKASQFPAVWVVESEIDCLRLWTLGIPAVALGTAHVSKEQKHLILNSCIEQIVIATDNDNAGRQCADQLTENFVGSLDVKIFVFPREDAKDISDLKNSEILSAKIIGIPIEID